MRRDQVYPSVFVTAHLQEHWMWTSAILSVRDFGLAMVLFTLLVFWKLPPWFVVILSAFGGWVVAMLPSLL